MSRSQLMAVGICIVLNMLDGFDVLVMAFTSASVASEWKLSGAQLGFLLSAGLFGMTGGSLFLAPWADRFGRRTIVLVCLALCCGGMLASALARNNVDLAILRIVTGIGIGGMLASINVITSEQSSERWRSTAVSLQATGYPVGATIGGTIAAVLIAHYGWRSVFLFGGLCSAAMFPMALRHLPEGKPSAPQTFALKRLFAPGMARPSILMALAFFLHMCSFYFVLSWTPKLLVAAGLSTKQGITGGVLLNVGGIVGGSLFGYLSARYGLQRLIAISMVTAASFVAAFGFFANDLSLAFPIALAIGAFIFASMVGLYSLTPILYPASIRATGMGWSIGMGRFGAILSPAATGFLVDGGWTSSALYCLYGLPMIGAALAMGSIRVPPATEVRPERPPPLSSEPEGTSVSSHRG